MDRRGAKVVMRMGDLSVGCWMEVVIVVVVFGRVIGWGGSVRLRRLSGVVGYGWDGRSGGDGAGWGRDGWDGVFGIWVIKTAQLEA